MKKLQKILIAVAAGAFAAFTATADPTTQGVGTVVRVEGIASYSLDGGSKWIPLVAGEHLPPGSQIHTGYNGVVDVVLGKAIALPQADWQPDRISEAADSPVRGLVSYKPSAEQNVVRLVPDSTLAIDKLTITDTGADTVGDTELNLTAGKIFACVKKLSGTSQYLVKIPTGVAGVRGTYFSISVDGYTVVFETHQNAGLVLAITPPGGGPTVTILIGAGYGYNPAGGSSTPTPLTPQEIHILQKIFSAVPTIYQAIVNFSYDHTGVYVSTTRGVGGSGSGSGGGGGGGGVPIPTP